jgi:hypothetical protein
VLSVMLDKAVGHTEDIRVSDIYATFLDLTAQLRSGASVRLEVIATEPMTEEVADAAPGNSPVPHGRQSSGLARDRGNHPTLRAERREHPRTVARDELSADRAQRPASVGRSLKTASGNGLVEAANHDGSAGARDKGPVRAVRVAGERGFAEFLGIRQGLSVVVAGVMNEIERRYSGASAA